MLHLDFETRSEVDLKESGLDNYARHESTKCLMLAWAFGQEEPQLWLPHEGPMPERLINGLQDPAQELAAFNSSFERYILQHVLKITISASRFHCPQASARYLSLPAHLEEVGMVLGLPLELRKDKKGKQLIELFSMPHFKKKKDGGDLYFNDHVSHPEEFAAFGEYCRQDIRAEREIARRLKLLGVFPLPERERRIWLMDQAINDRGIPTSNLIEKAFKLAERAKQEKLEEQNKATGLENANSQSQLLPWAQDRGYPLSNLRKQNIELVLKDKEVELAPECRSVLTARMEASSTSYKKLQAILHNISPDGRLRNQFIYCGASRTGRFSGNAVQLQNLARPGKLNGYNFEELEVMSEAREMIRKEDYEGLKVKYGSVLLVVKNLIRTFFSCEDTDKKLLVADLASIETRMGAWLAQCAPLLRVFIDGKDAYLDFAAKIYGIPYDKLWADYKGKNGKEAQIAAKRMRQTAKPGVLGAIYRLGGGQWGRDKNGDRIKTGLWGYAEAMGVEMSQEQAHEVVRIFREAYKEIPQMWFTLENAISDVLNGERTIRYVGPENCIKIDKLTIEERNPILRIWLPSGHCLHYIDAAIETVKMPWQRKNDETGESEDVYRPGFTYYSQNQDTKQWDLTVSHGGKTFEQITQALSRDILCEDMLAIEEAGASIVIHAHDEPVCEVQDDLFSPSVEDVIELMSQPVPWASGLPLGADGFSCSFYRK